MTRILLTNKSASEAKMHFSIDGVPWSVAPASLRVRQASSADPSVNWTTPQSPSPLPMTWVGSANLVVLPPYSVTEVQIASVLPSFSVQPQSQAINVGDTVTLSGVASGLPAPSLQWYFNGAPLAGSTGSSYTIANAALTDAGSYYAVASNTAGHTQSQAAGVTVSVVPPTFVSISVPSSVKSKSPVTLSVVATGTMPLQYQWYLDKTPILGATNATYSIASVASKNAGSYHVKISNSAGSISSTWVKMSLYK